jgi:DNA-binding transcriptional regulator YhcF (GntR family)
MNVDPASVWPLSAQLAQLLRELIRSGELSPGDRVPSEPQLSRQYSVSRDTAQRALAMLAEEGLITRRRGVGSIVAVVDPVKEVRARPGARITARLPTVAEQQSTRAGMWVPLLAVEEPGWPEKLYPADRVVVVVPPDEDEKPAELQHGCCVFSASTQRPHRSRHGRENYRLRGGRAGMLRCAAR